MHPQDVAILTGASRGIGFAVAQKMAERGYQLVLNSRHPEEAAEDLRKRYNATIITVPGDVAAHATTEALIQAARELGGLDGLFLNLGGPPVKTLEETEEEEWETYFRSMVLGPLRLFKASLPLFRQRGGGRVVAITSFTVKQPYPQFILSNSLRAALNNALKTAALDYGPENILVNTVAPGFIFTDRVRQWLDMQAQRQQRPADAIRASVEQNIPLRRMGKPEEIAEVIAFLLSRQNGYVTGQQLLVDGGLVVAN